MRLRVQPRFLVLLITAMVLIFGISFAVGQHTLKKGSETLTELQAERIELQAEILELQEELEYVKTDEYVIRVARDELGMIMPDEIRYITD